MLRYESRSHQTCYRHSWTIMAFVVFLLCTASARADCSSDDTLCLSGGRFRVSATWAGPGGTATSAHAVLLTSDSGYFWFLESGNVEVAVKVLNGCSVNDRYWVFAAGLTNLDVRIAVMDNTTNRTKTYTNSPGSAFQSISDTNALDVCDAAPSTAGNPEAPALTSVPATSSSAPALTCTTSDTTLCLDGRFAVKASWQSAGGQAGTAHGV